MSSPEQFMLTVPLDASAVEGLDTDRDVKVLLHDADGVRASEVVRFNADGQAEASFALDGKPGGLKVVVGPADAADDMLLGMRTITSSISAREWRAENTARLTPIKISPYFWNWWWNWCRTFTIHGTVVCADGSPVPGAKVCARDVDWLWWWKSESDLCCATTDVNGAFEMKFTWCCGFWPWWWWGTRLWTVDPHIADRIQTSLFDKAQISLPAPSPVPSLAVFESMLDQPAIGGAAITDPSILAPMREELVAKLPAVHELQTAQIWPWVPWRPWSDCTPDLIFRVTQNCGDGEKVIVDEGYFDTRWDIPTTLNVTLEASADACCITDQPPSSCGDTECVALAKVCGTVLTGIGGNLGTAGPAGYYNPGGILNSPPGSLSVHNDRPFAGGITITGVCAEWADYYEFETSTDGVSWAPIPLGYAAGFSLRYFDILDPDAWPSVSFAVTPVDGRNVIESVGHWESVHGTKPWIDDKTTLVTWISGPGGPYPDGTYHLRMKAYQLTASGTLKEATVPPHCGVKDKDGKDVENVVTVTIDNRIVGLGSGHPHPSMPYHKCVGVHACTTEPDTDIIGVWIDGKKAPACTVVDASKASTVTIEFLVHDPDGHLAEYTLNAFWGEDEYHSLLPGSLLPDGTTMPGYLTQGTAIQCGPTYDKAVAGTGVANQPPATAPTWKGGTMTLTLTDVHKAFPVTCCYLLDLRASKRTIDSCQYYPTHVNQSTYALTVQV